MRLLVTDRVEHCEVFLRVGAPVLAFDQVVDVPPLICLQELTTTRAEPVLLLPQPFQPLAIFESATHPMPFPVLEVLTPLLVEGVRC